MYMQRRSEFGRAIEIEIDAHAIAKRDAAIRQNAIRIDNIHMASRSVMADWQGQAGWITLQVKERSELAVEKRLHDAEVMVFVPCENDRVEIRRGRKWVIPRSPIMNGYVQVRCAFDPRAIYGLLSVKSVIDIVGGAIRPWRTSDEDMNHFMAMHDDGSLQRLVADMRLKAGDAVRILAGPCGGVRRKPPGGYPVGPRPDSLQSEAPIQGQCGSHAN
jgi:transcriptional antiterminator NusG